MSATPPFRPDPYSEGSDVSSDVSQCGRVQPHLYGLPEVNGRCGSCGQHALDPVHVSVNDLTVRGLSGLSSARKSWDDPRCMQTLSCVDGLHSRGCPAYPDGGQSVEWGFRLHDGDPHVTATSEKYVRQLAQHDPRVIVVWRFISDWQIEAVTPSRTDSDLAAPLMESSAPSPESAS